jgi:hypothetical protein
LKSLVLAKINREKSKNPDWELNKPELVSLAAEISSKFSVLHDLVTPGNKASSFIQMIEVVVKDYQGISRKIHNEKKLYSTDTKGHGSPPIEPIQAQNSNANNTEWYKNHTRSILVDISNSKALMKSFAAHKSKLEEQKAVITILTAEKFALDHQILELKAKLNSTRRNGKINGYLNDLRNRGSFQKMAPANAKGVDRNIFLGFASLSKTEF